MAVPKVMWYILSLQSPFDSSNYYVEFALLLW